MNSILKRARIVALVLAVALAGWIGWQQFGSQSTPQGNLVGSSLGGAFQLVDQDGEPRGDADFRGQWRLMYFGYTFCPDVCPTDMAVMGRALQQFEASDPARGAKVTPIFTTVDPARDTPEAIKPFVKAFHPRFIGLTGSEPAVAAAMKTFGIYAKKAETRDPENYLVDHFAVFYLFDPEGRPVAFLPHGSEAADVVAMLNTHVR